MSDEGLHEIQLNGKQLFFRFMTASGVAGVIFLWGVMVGRGVPAQRGPPVLAPDGADPTTSDEARSTASAADAAATPTTAASSPAASPAAKLGLTYPDRLEEPEPVAEEVPAGVPAHEAFATTALAQVPPPPTPPKAVVKPAPASKSVAPAVATAPAAKEPKDTKDAAEATPAGNGYVVQVAAVRQKSEADAIRGRLTRKGYPAFVATAGPS